MKKSLCAVALCLVVSFGMALALTGCASQNEPQEQIKLENDTLTVDGIYIDESYQGSEAQDGMRRVYVFATVHPKSETLSISSGTASLKATKGEASDTYDSIDVIQYDTDAGSEAARWASSYYCSNVIEDVQPEKTFKIILPFNIADIYLEEGAKFELAEFNSKSEYAEGIEFPFSTINSSADLQAMAEQADPDGYKKALEARQDASSEVAQDVMNRLNGFKFYASTGTMIQTCSFAGDTFTHEAVGSEVSGTYTVKNGYLACVQSTTGWVNWIPWQYDETNQSGIDVDLNGTFTEK